MASVRSRLFWDWMRFARAWACCARADAIAASARDTMAAACSRSICSRSCPRVTICPSRTDSCVILPATSEATSTLVCGRTCPLAVTDATRSRCSTGSMRTSTALLPRLAAPRTATRTTTSPVTPAIDHFTFFVIVVALAKGATDRALERGEGPVVFVDCVQPVHLRLLEGAAAGGDVEECGRAHPVPLFRERKLLARGDRVDVVELDGLDRRLEVQVRLGHVRV